MARRIRTDEPSAFRRARALGADCDNCPLKGQTPVLGEGPVGAQLAVIGEAPGREEIKVSRPFIDKSGEALDVYLDKVGMPRSMVLVTNAIACFPPGGDLGVYLTIAKKEHKALHGNKKSSKQFKSPVDCCRKRLFNELRMNNCKTCGKFLGGPDEDSCVCRSPMPIHRHGPTVYVPMGNAAMESILGFEGITKWRGSALKRGR